MAVPEGQFESNSLQSSLFATQLLYLEHFTGLSTGHPLDSESSLSASHSSKSVTHKPLLGHLYGVIKGHPFAAGHLLLSGAHDPFSHLISPLGHVLALGHSSFDCLQVPSSHLTSPSAHVTNGLHSSYEGASIPSAQTT